MIKAQHSENHSNADYVGITGSVLCIIHCIATPLLALSSSVFFKDTLSEGMHLLGFVFILINGVAVYYATRNGHSTWLNRFLWGAFAVFAASLLLEESNEVFHYLGYFGSFLLIVGHSLNLYLCRRVHKH
ncbi:hypothetical protein GCM10023091_08860 [Ravibacter arvi]|uniref:MerC domain-containing protein n=1 Tax=Ravibacter arvi TaxID=2051041 RepID=A0ABP8LTL2_9BACT